MISRREGAAGIVHANTFIIFGGYDTNGSGYLSTTEIVTEEGQVTPGPEMPAAVNQHSITSLDARTCILTGGSTSNEYYSDVTWIFDHVSQEFQQGPPLITGRRGHASATLQDQDTKENIVAVVGGYRTGGYFLDSTEFLRNGQWSPGKLSCKTNKMCLFSFFFVWVCFIFFSKMETLFLISFPFLLHFRSTDAKKA